MLIRSSLRKTPQVIATTGEIGDRAASHSRGVWQLRALVLSGFMVIGARRHLAIYLSASAARAASRVIADPIANRCIRGNGEAGIIPALCGDKMRVALSREVGCTGSRSALGSRRPFAGR